ncbi:hypothetical protein NG99_14785 [Erwinia typographi]|uniref:DUF3289 family protein n=1 Tax=Erwinia typographi TaxID=371042 RepID=A0A0A3Z3P5_9GAMM|nr:DUF3289 family protein [Erwinia typographi]KGT92266.1 hypothetical protein NG99_14785 [Erwinia typographi]
MSRDTQALCFPFTVYQTQNRMDDRRADDMYCGDLTERQLKEVFRLEKIFGKIDPWTLERTDFPISNFAVIRHKMTHAEVAQRLFDEFRRDSWPFSFLGYRQLFLDMVNHFQCGCGRPFSSSLLNFAYKNQIESDLSSVNSSWLKIKNVLTANIVWDKGYYPDKLKNQLTLAVSNSVLPRFDRWKDNINGLGMSVHGVYATHITLRSLLVEEKNYRAVVHYKGQDHFGLDNRDIMSPKFHHLNIFRIWFVLQRWQKFAYRPFMTNMEATITIEGKLC